MLLYIAVFLLLGIAFGWTVAIICLVVYELIGLIFNAP